MSDLPETPGFDALGMPDFILKTLTELGYESPSPIQAAAIPVFLSGSDLIGQAQTGTGKTAAFALPILAQLEDGLDKPQALIMTPTRELAIQVAEAFQRYARHRKNFRIAPIYGGQEFYPQLKLLRQGVQVVVGTPGRLLDHLRRGTLDISAVKTLVLDEADEMLRMGFIDDVEEILGHMSGEQQNALFSATMPPPIKRIADKYLTDPQHVVIKAATATVDRIAQSYWMVDGRQKGEALRRYLETREFDAMIVFVRTREACSEVAEKVNAWGYSAEAIHGAISQNVREKTIQRLKTNKFDILVATDVAARGLDVDRFSHVVNYDIPYDSESYVHRIGRTGRAGRSGEAVLFVTHRETRLLHIIERHIRQKIERATMPNQHHVLQQRIERFKQRVTKAAEETPSPLMHSIVEQLSQDMEIEHQQLAALLVHMLQAELPLEPKETFREFEERGSKRGEREERGSRDGRDSREGRESRSSREPREGRESRDSRERREPREGRGERESRYEREYDETPVEIKPAALRDFPDIEMERFRIEVGKKHGAKPGDIVGAIANELELESSYIGEIHMRGEYSTVDLPEGMPKELLNQMKSIRVRQQSLRATRYGKEEPSKAEKKPQYAEGKPAGKKGPAQPRQDKPVKSKPVDEDLDLGDDDDGDDFDQEIDALIGNLTRGKPATKAEKAEPVSDDGDEISDESQEEAPRPTLKRKTGEREFSERKKTADDRKPSDKPFKKKSFGDKPFKEKSFKDKPFKDKPFKDKDSASKDKPFKEKSFKDKPFKDKNGSDKPFKDRPSKDKPFKEKSFKGKTGSAKPFSDRPAFKGKPKPKKS
ncbi:MAG TPA: DEAD/DEAH box helicase [Dongiaceae bacterium]|nr:DEAD/DEAH box helicase [Dongiaceae bacterium]